MQENEEPRLYIGMTQREVLFIQMAARNVVKALVTHGPMMKEAGREALDYYDISSRHKMYWTGWVHGIDAVVGSGEIEMKRMIRRMGGKEKAIYIAYGIAHGLRRYAEVQAGRADPIEIDADSFQIFKAIYKDLNDEDQDEGTD